MHSKSTAYTALYQTHYQKIYNYCFFRLNHDPEAATDLTQQVFTNAWKYFTQYEDRGFSYEAYLVRIAHNLLVNYYRDTQRRNERITSYDTESFFVEINYGKEDTYYVDLWKALLKIKIPRRYMLVLYYFEGYKTREIAHLFNKTENAVRQAIIRARKDFKRYVDG
jgi:RNA polymerase sigma-70 factor (ECF subfamily)